MSKIAYLDQLCTKQLLKLSECFYFLIYNFVRVDFFPKINKRPPPPPRLLGSQE